MSRWLHRSLLAQLLGPYLLFVLAMLAVGVAVNALVEQRLRADVQAADQALAQEIALQTGLTLQGAESAVIKLSQLPAVRTGAPNAMARDLQAFKAARSDVDHVYWVDRVGTLRLAVPQGGIAPGSAFAPPGLVERALLASGPVVEVGVADTTAFDPGVLIADPVRDARGNIAGFVAANISLQELSDPLTQVADAQARQNHHLAISIIDDRGELIAAPHNLGLLDTVLDELPGAAIALHGNNASLLATGPGGQDWLYSAVPVPVAGWAVVVGRQADEALEVVTEFHRWLYTSLLLFAAGGLVFWLVLLSRVIRPLHSLAIQHRGLPAGETPPAYGAALASRGDEVGGLARSLQRLERDVLAQLAELRTLLETSNAVVGSLEPRAVVGTIIREARRLVDVQAAAVLVPDETGVLRVLVSEGHSERYDHALARSPDDVSSASVLALRDGRPVQKILTPERAFPSPSYDEGFRAVLAIPIISRHAGGVVLLVHRTEPHAFSENEIDLLLTFANYATLAWEHAVLYERSDERLRETAAENARLYRVTMEEKQTLAAIMGSMSDGLALTGSDGAILYANPGVRAILGLDQRPRGSHQANGSSGSSEASVWGHIRDLYAALREAAADRAAFEQALACLETSAPPEAVVEIVREGRRRAIHLRLFDVGGESGQAVGRGLLLRDVTREREIDELKTTLLAAVGHELRTPLAAIKGHASTLLQDDVTWPVEEQRHFLRTISGEADRLARLVSNLLDLSRQEAGLLLLNRAPTHLPDLVARTVERLSHPSVAVTAHLAGDLPPLDVDAARIEVVLHNLLANAVAYGDGEVRVGTERRGDAVVISVSDNGPGIAPDELPLAFERFYRARRGRERRSGGTGLGLAIGKAFVEAHGGAIWAESSGQGTTIAFSLPLTLPADATATASLAPMPRASDDTAERSHP